MDKEQIIIDGVDVSECKYALLGKHTIICASSEGRALCDANTNCLYKQLARKTQECEELEELLKLRTNDRINKLERAIIRRNVKIARYRKALEEIERELKEDIYCESQECGCDDYEECLRCTKNIILNIINKVKGEGNED